MPRTILPDARVSPRFAGLATFCRVPRLADVDRAQRPVDWAIYGVPFDGGVTYRPGARFGPRAIRDASQYVKRYSMHHAVDVCERLSIADAGDAPVSPFDLPGTLALVGEHAAGLADPSTRLLAVGGDHSVALANIRATHARLGRGGGGKSARRGGKKGAPMPLIHFDAHLDTTDEVWGSRWSHASPFRRAIEEGLIDPRLTISLGIRGPLNSGDDLRFARQSGITVIAADDLVGCNAARGQARLSAFVKKLGRRPAYVSFDVDVVDPAFAPGTGTPASGGLSSVEAIALVRALRGVTLAGADVVEVLPDRDHAGCTALLAATILFEIISLDALRRK
ncbi:MAG: agmatinase [Phycisphaerales bacterium]